MRYLPDAVYPSRVRIGLVISSRTESSLKSGEDRSAKSSPENRTVFASLLDECCGMSLANLGYRSVSQVAPKLVQSSVYGVPSEDTPQHIAGLEFSTTSA